MLLLCTCYYCTPRCNATLVGGECICMSLKGFCNYVGVETRGCHHCRRCSFRGAHTRARSTRSERWMGSGGRQWALVVCSADKSVEHTIGAPVRSPTQGKQDRLTYVASSTPVAMVVVMVLASCRFGCVHSESYCPAGRRALTTRSDQTK